MDSIKSLIGNAALSLAFNQHAVAQKPNVIFIVADDLGRADLPAYGHRTVNTQCLTYLS